MARNVPAVGFHSDEGLVYFFNRKRTSLVFPMVLCSIEIAITYSYTKDILME